MGGLSSRNDHGRSEGAGMWNGTVSTRVPRARKVHAGAEGFGWSLDEGIHEAPRQKPPEGQSRQARKADALAAKAQRASGGAAGRQGLERGLGFLLLALAFAMLSGFVLLVLPPVFKVNRYEIRGAARMSSEEVLRASLLRGNESYFSLDTSATKASLRSDPRIADARVERLFPNAVRMTVMERKPVAIVLAEVDGRLRPVCLDAEGVAFASDHAGAGSPEVDIPVLSGIRFEGFKYGTRLPRSFVPTIEALAAIEASTPSLLQAFSEIKLVKPANGELELLLFPLHHRILVRTGAVLNESTLRSIILVLEVLGSDAFADKARAGSGRGGGMVDGLEEIDFRTGTVVYRMKGGQTG